METLLDLASSSGISALTILGILTFCLLLGGSLITWITQQLASK